MSNEGNKAAVYCYCSVRPHIYNANNCGPGTAYNNAPIDRTQPYPYERLNDAYVENELATQYD